MNKPLKSGSHVAVLAAEMSACSHGQHDKLVENMVNEYLERLEKEAFSAGFLTDVKSVTVHEPEGRISRITILYKLSDDPSFRPPM